MYVLLCGCYFEALKRQQARHITNSKSLYIETTPFRIESQRIIKLNQMPALSEGQETSLHFKVITYVSIDAALKNYIKSTISCNIQLRLFSTHVQLVQTPRKYIGYMTQGRFALFHTTNICKTKKKIRIQFKNEPQLRKRARWSDGSSARSK